MNHTCPIKDILGEVPEIYSHIFSFHPLNQTKGLLRCVEKYWRDVIDLTPETQTKPSCCFVDKSIFDFALQETKKSKVYQITSSSVHLAIENNSFKSDESFAQTVFLTIPVRIEILNSMIVMKRLDLLKVLANNWPFINLKSGVLESYMIQMLLNHTEMYNYVKDNMHLFSVESYKTLYPRLKQEAMSNNLSTFDHFERITKEFPEIYKLDAWNQSFDIKTLIENKQALIAKYGDFVSELSITRLPLDQLTHLKTSTEKLDYIQQILSQLNVFVTLFPSIDIQFFIIQMVDWCYHHNFVEGLKMLLPLVVVTKQKEIMIQWFQHCPISPEMLSFWLTTPDFRVLFPEYKILIRILANNQSDAFVQFTNNGVDPFSQSLPFSSFQKIESIEIFQHLLHLIDTNNNIKDSFKKLVIQIWHLFETFFFPVDGETLLLNYTFLSRQSPICRAIAFKTFIKTINYSSSHSFENIINLFCNGDFDFLFSVSYPYLKQIQDWIINLYISHLLPHDDDPKNWFSFSFKSLEHCKRFLPFLCMIKKIRFNHSVPHKYQYHTDETIIQILNLLKENGVQVKHDWTNFKKSVRIISIFFDANKLFSNTFSDCTTDQTESVINFLIHSNRFDLISEQFDKNLLMRCFSATVFQNCNIHILKVLLHNKLIVRSDISRYRFTPNQVATVFGNEVFFDFFQQIVRKIQEKQFGHFWLRVPTLFQKAFEILVTTFHDKNEHVTELIEKCFKSHYIMKNHLTLPFLNKLLTIFPKNKKGSFLYKQIKKHKKLHKME
jgi:hypothetical protein